MLSNKRDASLVVVLGGVLASMNTAGAIEASDILSVNAGPLVFRPRLTLAEQYNDNLFYQSQGMVGDFITVVHPELETWLGKGQGERSLMFRYGLNSLFYAANDVQNSTDHAFELTGKLKGARLSSENRYAFEYLSSIYGGYVTAEQGTTVQAQTIERMVYDLGHTFGYEITERTRAYLQGTFNATDFAKGVPVMDVNTTRGTLGFAFKALPKTSFLGEVYYSQAASGPNVPTMRKGPHADFVGGFLGAEGQFTPKLKGSVRMGYEASEFADGSGGSSSPVVEAALTAAFTEKVSASLTYSRRGTISVQSAGQALTYDVAGLQFRQVIGAKGRLAATAFGEYRLNDYGNKGVYAGRVDDHFRVGGALTYQMKLWLRASLGYEFEKLLSSDSRALDYDVNRVTFTLAVGY